MISAAGVDIKKICGQAADEATKQCTQTVISILGQCGLRTEAGASDKCIDEYINKPHAWDKADPVYSGAGVEEPAQKALEERKKAAPVAQPVADDKKPAAAAADEKKEEKKEEKPADTTEIRPIGYYFLGQVGVGYFGGSASFSSAIGQDNPLLNSASEQNENKYGPVVGNLDLRGVYLGSFINGHGKGLTTGFDLGLGVGLSWFMQQPIAHSNGTQSSRDGGFMWSVGPTIIGAPHQNVMITGDIRYGQMSAPYAAGVEGKKDVSSHNILLGAGIYYMPIRYVGFGVNLGYGHGFTMGETTDPRISNQSNDLSSNFFTAGFGVIGGY